MNVTNNGDYGIILEERSSLQMLPNSWDGNANSQIMYFIRADSTQSAEDPGAYTNWDKILAIGVDTKVYFGSIKAGEGAKQKLYGNRGTMSVSLLVFGVEDTDGDGDETGEPPYSQNLPFLGIASKDP